ncbi:MAG: hypothetical protein B7X53_01080 [Hyphomonas sp. 34-62-18]|nr:MAG: hypothetical protein B7X53_01080 [Hyphomonas sp. 34-62-18]
MWKNWMVAWCGGVILFGVVLAAGGLPATDGAVTFLYNLLGGLAPGELNLDAPGMRFSIALMGGRRQGAVDHIPGGERQCQAAPGRRAGSMNGREQQQDRQSPADRHSTDFALNIVPNTALAVAYLVPVMASGVLRTAGR